MSLFKFIPTSRFNTPMLASIRKFFSHLIPRGHAPGLLIILCAFIIFFSGCQNKNSKSELIKQIGDIDISVDSTQEVSIKKVFFNLPSPIELTQIILASNSTFNPNLLNPVEEVNNYSSSSKLALNFGIYGADLCYCRAYDQLQESISYLATIRKISDKLQIPDNEGSETIKRIEESIEDRDLIFEIIADTYANADGYLKENERDLAATFILIGGWVEGMYFSVNINNNDESKNKFNINIAEQKFAFQNLMILIDNYLENTTIAELHPLFIKLNKIYDGISITYDSPVVITDQETRVTTIDNSANIDVTQQQLDEITDLIIEIRSIIVS